MVKLELTDIWQHIGSEQVEVQLSSNHAIRLYYGKTSPPNDLDSFLFQNTSKEFQILAAPIAGSGYIWVRKETSATQYIKYRIVNNDSVVTDSLGNQAEIGLFGGTKVSQANVQVSLVFNKPLNLSREVKISGDVTSMHNGSLLKVGGAVGVSNIETIEVLRYKTAQTIETYFTSSWSRIAFNGEEALIGLFDTNDGVYLGYKNFEFIVGYRHIDYGDITQAIDISAFDFTKIHRFRIKFGYLGVGNISFEVFVDSKWHLLHIFETDGNLTQRTHVRTAILPMSCNVLSTEGTLELYSGSWNAQTYGIDSGQQEIPHFSQGTRVIDVNVGESLPLVAFRTVENFGGYINKVKSRLLTAEFATGSEGLYRINFLAYPAGSIATGTFVDLFVDESVMQINTDVTTIPLNGKIVYSITLAVPSSGAGVFASSADFTKLGLKTIPGFEYLIVKECLMTGGGNDITTWNIAYVDLF